jgi:hypothetical protein
MPSCVPKVFIRQRPPSMKALIAVVLLSAVICTANRWSLRLLVYSPDTCFLYDQGFQSRRIRFSPSYLTHHKRTLPSSKVEAFSRHYGNLLASQTNIVAVCGPTTGPSQGSGLPDVLACQYSVGPGEKRSLQHQFPIIHVMNSVCGTWVSVLGDNRGTYRRR